MAFSHSGTTQAQPAGHVPRARLTAAAQPGGPVTVRGPHKAPGMRPGQLPAGYLPLTPALRAQARQAAQEILHQTGNH